MLMPSTADLSGGGSPASTDTLRELIRIMYHPNFSSDPDQSLYVANRELRCSPPLTHATVKQLTEKAARFLIERLRPIFRDRREEFAALAVQSLLGAR